MTSIEWTDHPELFSQHAFDEHIADLGEIRMNYAVAGEAGRPVLLMVPGQTESWWGYEEAMRLLAERYQVYAVDLRGQGRSTWTPGRDSVDLFGTDLVRFIDRVIGQPVIVSGLSSGGVISAWLAAFATPGQVTAAVLEDPPLFSSEADPAVGASIRQAIGYRFRLLHKWLGPPPPGDDRMLREYDPEWAEAFYTGRVALTCDHENMLRQVKVPVLFTHHFRVTDPETGNVLGAISDQQASHARKLIEGTGNPVTYRSFPSMAHSMHGADPALYSQTIDQWIETLWPDHPGWPPRPPGNR